MTNLLMLPLAVLTLLQVPPEEAAMTISSKAGGIRGRYYLLDGPPVAGALAVVTHSDGRSWKVQTRPSGEFRLGMLPPGVYSLDVSRAGLHPFRRKEIQVIKGAWFVWDPPCGSTAPIDVANGGVKFQKDKSHYEGLFGSGAGITNQDLQKIPMH